MSYEDYRAIEAMNWSSLKEMNISARMYQWRQSHPRPETEALLMGLAIHCAILEPDKFASRYIIRPPGIDLRTKAGKEWKADLDPSKALLTADQGYVIEQCHRSVMAHPTAAKRLDGTRREETTRWQIDGIGCKARLDAISSNIIIDLKSCRDLGRFKRDFERYLYHGQLAFYRDGAVEAEACDPDARVYAIAVETSEPYDCGVYRVPDDALEVGRELYKSLLGYWRECHDADQWPGQCPTEEEIELSRWAAGGMDDGDW